MQMLCGGNDKSFKVRSQLGDVIDEEGRSQKGELTESPVPWQDCLVIERVHLASMTWNRKMGESTDRSDTKKHSLSALWRVKERFKGNSLSGTYLTRLTRYLLVALDLKSNGKKRMRRGVL